MTIDGSALARKRATQACDPALLDGVLRALPVGLALRDEAGALVFEGGAPPPAKAADAEVLTRSVTVEGRHYALTTTLDQAHHRRLEADLFQRAYFDDLTGLPNRAYIENIVDDLMSRHDAGPQPGDRFALAFIDVDNFKHINDYYSHAVGDAILVKIARRIADHLGPGDVLARIGGDEFVLLLNPVTGPERAIVEVEALLERLKQPFFADDHEIFASASIGISLFPDHGSDYGSLRRNADIAMYRVKAARKGAAAIFDDGMRMAAHARMETEQRLRLAIRDRCFLCAYQPKVDIRTGETVGLEVLLRWRDERGLIQPPGEFLALAVELGMINDITRMVLDETVGALPDLDSLFGPRCSISINVAAKQASDLGFMAAFVGDLKATGCAERFMIEFTEEAFFAKSALQATILPMLREIGTKVSIDDFGVGYSSLSALADLTADEIKIDRSFITDIYRRPRSQSILKAIESLGHALNMSIIAEGLESAEELTYLSAATRIRYAQGYYFAKPRSLDELVAARTTVHFSREQSRTRWDSAPRVARGR